MDAALLGGWPCGALTELLSSSAADAGMSAWRLLAPALAGLSQAHKPVVLVAPPGVLNALALQAMGLALPAVLLVRAEPVADALWSAEQALRALGGLPGQAMGSGTADCAGAVLCWLPARVPPGALRRLQLAASAGTVLSVVLRDVVARTQPSPAPWRLQVAPASGQRLAVTVFKRRGPPMSEPLMLHLPVTAAVPQHQPAPLGDMALPALHRPLHEALADMLARLRLGTAPSAGQDTAALLPAR
jgi:protein ImuA